MIINILFLKNKLLNIFFKKYSIENFSKKFIDVKFIFNKILFGIL